MRYIRRTAFDPVDPERRAVEVRPESALGRDIHVEAHCLRSVPCSDFVDVEVFDWDGDLRSAAAEAERRSERRIPPDKRNADILFDWLVSMFGLIHPGQRFGSRSPAPLLAEDIRRILAEAALHPNYAGQAVAIFCREGGAAVLKSGVAYTVARAEDVDLT